MKQQLAETTNKALDIVSPKLEGIPQIEDALEFVHENPLELTKVYLNYLRLTKKLLNLSGQDLELIHDALTEYKGGENSASSMDAISFLQMVGDKKDDLYRELVDVESQFLVEGSELLGTMMKNGSTTAESGEKPVDGDPIWDSVVWGHTQISGDRADIRYSLIHFTVCHYLERFVGNWMNENLELEEKVGKDSFLNALTDIISLEEAKRPGSTNTLDYWIPKQSEGGLEWMKQSRLDAFSKVMQAA